MNKLKKSQVETNKIDKDYYKNEAEIWHKFSEDIKNKFL